MPSLIYLIFIYFLALSPGTSVDPAAYRVVAIADGDSFTVMPLNAKSKIAVWERSDKLRKGHHTYRIRIDAIDAPEKGMPYYKVSKQHLAALCFEKTIRLKILKTDRYGRFVARVILSDGRDVSAEMIRTGMAWHYKNYSSDRKLAALELEARRKRFGLWKDKNPVAPWDARKAKRARKVTFN